MQFHFCCCWFCHVTIISVTNGWEHKKEFIDPLDRPTATATVGSDNCFRTCRPSVPIFQNLSKLNTFQAKTIFASDETLDLAEWIIDDACLVPNLPWNSYPYPFSIFSCMFICISRLPDGKTTNRFVEIDRPCLLHVHALTYIWLHRSLIFYLMIVVVWMFIFSVSSSFTVFSWVYHIQR